MKVDFQKFSNERLLKKSLAIITHSILSYRLAAKVVNWTTALLPMNYSILQPLNRFSSPHHQKIWLIIRYLQLLLVHLQNRMTEMIFKTRPSPADRQQSITTYITQIADHYSNSRRNSIVSTATTTHHILRSWLSNRLDNNNSCRLMLAQQQRKVFQNMSSESP